VSHGLLLTAGQSFVDGWFNNLWVVVAWISAHSSISVLV
jgi:hypothetical protein